MQSSDADGDRQWVHPNISFADESQQGINIRSVPLEKTYKIVKDGNSGYAQGARVQTEKITLVNRRLNSVESKDQETQPLSAQDSLQGSEEVTEEAIMGFLRTVMPMMEKELGKAQESALAFDAYDPLWDDKDDTCKEIRKLWMNDAIKVPEWLDKKKVAQGDIHRGQVMDVAWNATGTTVACAYGRLDTYGWCDITAPVCVWRNIFGRDKLVEGKADLHLEVHGFVHALSFHPTEPAILAGGTYNGELLIWNTNRDDHEDPLVASSSIDDYFHREAIQAVEWIPADISSEDSYLIATVSADAKVLIWDPRENDLSYPSRGWSLMGGSKEGTMIPGRSLSFSPLDPWCFVVGCETGAVLRCFRTPPAASVTSSAGQFAWKPSAVALLDQLSMNQRLALTNHVESYGRKAGTKEITAGVVFESKPAFSTIFPPPKSTALEAHAGPVGVVTFSPYIRRLLLTGSYDGAVRLYDVLQPRATMTFFPPSRHLSTCAISAVAWSISRPCVFAVAMEMGGVYIYDLLESKQTPVRELPISERVTSLKFNPTQRGIISVGDDTGRVRLFQIPWGLSQQQKNELPFMQSYLSGKEK